MDRIGILAGGGRLPLVIAESMRASGRAVHIVAIEGEADPEISRFPHTWVNWGQIGRIVSTLRAEGGRDVVIAGGVTRPDLWRIRPDQGFFRSLPRILELMSGGDDSVLTRVVAFLEREGLRVHAAHEVAPGLLAGSGALAGIGLSEHDAADAEIGFAIRTALGAFDAGQAVIVADRKVLAIEGAEGTDAMLRRVAAVRGGRGTLPASGVLAKGPKPGQELRVDMPAIGPRTVDGVAAAHLAAIALEASGVLILDREETVRRAAVTGISIQGLPSPARDRSVSAVVRSRSGRVIGRLCPSRRETADLEKGLGAVDALAPFATGASAAVSRAHILAIEAGEGIAAMLERVRALRQWGDRRSKRRIGVVVRRIEEGAAEDWLEFLNLTAAQGLAGAAVLGSERALEPYRGAAPVADKRGLFLITCETIGQQSVGSDRV